jgi:cobalt/nickel transport protein
MKRLWPFVLAALGVCLLLAVIVSPFASSAPDGLERVAQDQGFLQKAEGSQLWEASPIPDYAMPGVRASGLSTGLAGLAGTLIVFGLGLGLGRLLVSRRATGGSDAEAARRGSGSG